MAWINRISRSSLSDKLGIYRILLPPSLYRRFSIDPVSLRDITGEKVVRFFSPHGDSTCLVEISLKAMEDPLYSIQISDTSDITRIDWDFLIVNDPGSERYNTNVDEEGRDTMFGWASRNIAEEQRAMEQGLCPGQTRKGLRITGEVINVLESFCRMFDIKSIRLEALFYHNAIVYERYGFGYLSGYPQMMKINELFQPGGKLHNRLDGGSPFRMPQFAQTVRGRSWAIHDQILEQLEDEVLEDGWVSPVMYRMVDKPRAMVTFPDPVF